MKQDLETIIVKIEEFMNTGKLHLKQSAFERGEKGKNSFNIVSGFSDKQKSKIEEYVKGLETAPTQQEFVCEKMRIRGYVYEDGQLNFVRFYTYAQISPDVWHTFITGKHRPSEDTMFKIMIALQLDEDDAEYFLSLNGAAFNQSNSLHKYILACINTKIFDPDEVYEVLKIYKVHNIYREKKPRKDCK